MEPENESRREALLLKYWYILRKRWAVIALFTGALVASATVVSLISPKYYAATATIEIRPQAPTVLDVEQVSQLVNIANPDERRAYYATQYLILTSRTVLSEVIRRLREDHGVTDFDELDNPVKAIREMMVLEPEMNTFIVYIRFELEDPEKAALFANTVAETYMDVNLKRSIKATEDALRFLDDQRSEYLAKKRESDEKLHDFRYANNIVGASERREAIFDALDKLVSSANEVQIERLQAEASVERLSQLEAAGDFIELATYMSREDAVLQDRLRNLRTREQERTALVTRYLPGHPKVAELDNEIAGLQAQVKEQVRQIVDSRKAALQVVKDRERVLQEEIERLKVEAEELDRKLIEYNLLSADAEKTTNFFKSLDQRRTEVDIAKVIESNNVQFVDEAVPNYEPTRPKLERNVPVALFIGLVGGIALVFFLEYIDRTIRGPEDVEQLIGVPALGPLPMLAPEDIAPLSELDRNIYVFARPKSQVAERLRDIRTNILFRTPDKGQRRLLITSALPMEGKSFVSSNLCAIIAMTGNRVLLIDADLRRPTQHKLFEIDASVGLSSVLVGEATVSQAIQRTHVPNLDIMPAGPQLPTSVVSPAELFDSDRMTTVLNALQGYDIVVIDTSPLGAVADPLILSRFVDGVLLVVFSHQTPRELVLTAASRLREMKANLLGAVVNKFDARRGGYGYGYGYGYYSYGYGYYGEDRDQERKDA